MTFDLISSAVMRPRRRKKSKSATPAIVSQPLWAHRAEVAQEMPRSSGTPAAEVDDSEAGNDEREKDG